MSTLEERLAALERTVAELAGAPAPASTAAASGQDFWVLEELRRRHPEGAVVFAGTAAVGKGEVAWQWGAQTEDLREAD